MASPNHNYYLQAKKLYITCQSQSGILVESNKVFERGPEDSNGPSLFVWASPKAPAILVHVGATVQKVHKGWLKGDIK